MTELPTPTWDTDLPADALRRLSPRDKRARVEASLQRKVALVEAAAADAGCEGLGELPANRTQLRGWKDAEARLWPWAVPALDDPGGSNGPFTKRFLAAVEALRSRKPRRGASLPSRRALLSGRAVILEQQNAILEQQNAILEQQTASLKRQVVKLLQQLRTRGLSLDDVRR